MSHTTGSRNLQDLWTDSSEYRRCYQTDDEVDRVLGLLGLEDARGMVDVGCGNGAFAVAAARRHPGCRVCAFDALESAAAECRARARDLLWPNLFAAVAWAHALPLPDAWADRALCRSVLHHVAKPRPVYEEIARVLAPGGRLVLQTPCNYWEPALADVLSDMMVLADDTHRRFYYRPDEVVGGLERAGFHVTQPECWTYSFPFLDDRQADLVRRHQATDRLCLRPIGAGHWCIDNYWLRVRATKAAGARSGA
jgi:ubiquinone/menaquinone biosynthesis C-methylase UbiE